MKFKEGDILIKKNSNSIYVGTIIILNVASFPQWFNEREDRYLVKYPDGEGVYESEWIEPEIVEDNFKLDYKTMRRQKLRKLDEKE